MQWKRAFGEDVISFIAIKIFIFIKRGRRRRGRGGKAASIRILMSGFDNYVHFLRWALFSRN